MTCNAYTPSVSLVGQVLSETVTTSDATTSKNKMQKYVSKLKFTYSNYLTKQKLNCQEIGKMPIF